ncbi:MAG: aminopeptidase N, partial [Synechococcus sp.]|nr:aminopeptidase N [Synechococcus sp.]
MSLVRLADYRPAPYRLERTDLVVHLHADHTEVEASLAFLPNPAAGPAGGSPAPLELQGVDLELLELRIDGQALQPDDYQLGPEVLQIAEPPAGPFLLESRVRLHPETNSSLEGLYVSGGLFTTQCEAEGFRRITFHPDRPDLLSRFRVRIEADHNSCPVLLSNGNCLETGALPPDPVTGAARHFAIW